MRKRKKRGNGGSPRHQAPPVDSTTPNPRTTTGPLKWYGNWFIVGVVALLIVGITMLYRFMGEREPEAVATAKRDSTPVHFVSDKACSSCHAKQYGAWRGSHHSLAMQVASTTTVLGDFANARFTYAGITSTFFRRDGGFYVNTDGPDGTLADYEIKYTFGVTPLQQYLVEFPGGSLQALSIAWDARPKEVGGQRWFHLYPDEQIDHNDELHWTGPQQNWNYMCADCHSTNLRKNYSAETITFNTTWSDINVSCEACHGPGSRHVEWAQLASTDAGRNDAMMGLTVSFKERQGMHWTMDAQRGIAVPDKAQPLRNELEVCAPCHSRRTPIADGFEAGRPFLDYYLPALLEPPLYFADGQQREEVYTWGSFVQSRMYHQGVTCSDCHEPHSLKLRASGNGVCAQCHLPAKYDAVSHHFHNPGSAGAQCVACHMPAKTYMVIDPRHDHSIRVPRPDLTITLGVPNACTQCHADKEPQWAADQMLQWYGHPSRGFQHYALAFDNVTARNGIAPLLEDHSQPAIALATAAAAIVRAPDAVTVEAARKSLADESALVRYAALGVIELLPPEGRVAVVAPLLNDPVRLVRMEAARVLAPVPVTALTSAQMHAFKRAADEYIAAQQLHADRPENRTNLGSFYAQLGRYQEAEAEFRAAMALPPVHVPAWVNFADMRRLQGRDADAEALLRDGLHAAPDNAALHHSLGLTLVRLGRNDESIRELADAARLAPNVPRFAYVYAVALQSTGQLRAAVDVLAQALTSHPDDRDMLLAAILYSRDLGDHAEAMKYAERLEAQSPGDSAVQRLQDELRSHPDKGK